ATSVVATPIIQTTNAQAVPQVLSQQELDFTQFRDNTETSKESNLPPVQLMTPYFQNSSFNSSTNSNSNTNKPVITKINDQFSNMEKELESLQIKT
ncbi:hypothetical protein, partial [Salmonella sp. s51228]|uniref:hypothetical protein n=1 Tax=Salmonella sp. s51228 TaxID=3159652 RepID=UPI00397F80EA